MKTFLKKIIKYILILVIRILKVIVVLKFAKIYTSRIGHLSVNTDIAISILRKNQILLLAPENFISNTYLYKLFKKNEKVFFNKFLNKLISLISISSDDEKLILTWKDYQPSFNKYYIKKKNITIPKIDIDEFNNFLQKKKIKKNFICFHNRDSKFLQSINYNNDKNFHEYRDYKFNDFKLSISYLLKKNSIIRLGKLQKQFLFKDTNYYDFTKEYNEKYIHINDL